MNKKLKVLLCLFILYLPFSAKADPVDFAIRHPMLSLLGVGTVVYLDSVIHISRHLSKHTDEVEPYFKRHPKDFNPVSKYVLNALAHPLNKSDYDRYKKLAEIMGLENIPPYVTPAATPELKVPESPVQVPDATSGIHENPMAQSDPSSNIIHTPKGEPFDTSTEFPNERISTWEDYLFLKTESQKLADNMEAAGLGKRPAGYAAHHIVAWSKSCYAVCQDLRDLLDNNGIGINDSINGVYLPHFKATKNKNEAYHPGIHTEKYYDDLFIRLQLYNGNTESLKNELSIVARELKTNTFNYDKP